jgi:hypothetical protein
MSHNLKKKDALLMLYRHTASVGVELMQTSASLKSPKSANQDVGSLLSNSPCFFPMLTFSSSAI